MDSRSIWTGFAVQRQRRYGHRAEFHDLAAANRHDPRSMGEPDRFVLGLGGHNLQGTRHLLPRRFIGFGNTCRKWYIRGFAAFGSRPTPSRRLVAFGRHLRCGGAAYLREWDRSGEPATIRFHPKLNTTFNNRRRFNFWAILRR